MYTGHMDEKHTEFTLANGQTVQVRPIRAQDAPLLVEMFHHLSPRTRRLRFHSYMGDLPRERVWREAIALSDLDPARQVALVASYKDDAGEHIVGVARFARATAQDEEAEAAIVVQDDFQGMGLGSHLLLRLVSLARQVGIRHFAGWIMAENVHMLHILKKAHLPIRRQSRSGETFVQVSLEAPAETPD